MMPQHWPLSKIPESAYGERAPLPTGHVPSTDASQGTAPKTGQELSSPSGLMWVARTQECWTSWGPRGLRVFFISCPATTRPVSSWAQGYLGSPSQGPPRTSFSRVPVASAPASAPTFPTPCPSTCEPDLLGSRASAREHLPGYPCCGGLKGHSEAGRGTGLAEPLAHRDVYLCHSSEALTSRCCLSEDLVRHEG